MKFYKLNNIKRLIDFNLFFPFFIVLSFVGIINSLQTYFIYHKTKNPFSYLLLSKLIYNWYFVVLAFIILLLVNNRKDKFLYKLVIDTIVIAAAIISHQILQYFIETFLLVKKSFDSIYQMIFYNPLVWLDIAMVIFFYMVFNLIENKKRKRENELKEYQLKEKLTLSKLRELKSKINPSFLNESLEKISELIIKNKDEEANDLLTSLSEFLRISLYYDEYYATLKEELNSIEKFLSIERINSNRKIELEIKLNSSLYYILIPSFSMLFIVKNICGVIKEDINLEIYSDVIDNDVEIKLKIVTKDCSANKIDEIKKQIADSSNISLIKNSDDCITISIKYPIHKEIEII